MPLPSAHLGLATLVLDGWSGHPSHAPFSPYLEANRNAFYQGALGPDMGLFPGGEPLLSEMAHRHRPGDLARALIDRARNDGEHAFAWGWLTHVIADVEIHPLINACARRLVLAAGGDPDEEVALGVQHFRVELGLDVHVLLRDPRVRGHRLVPCFDARSVEFLRGAYRDVYGLSLNPEWLLRSHRAVGRLAGALAMLERLHALAAPERRPRLRRRALRLLGRLAATRLAPRSRAFLEPVAPTRALLRQLVDTAASFRETIRRHQVEGLLRLGNPDLEGMAVPELLSA